MATAPIQSGIDALVATAHALRAHGLTAAYDSMADATIPERCRLELGRLRLLEATSLLEGTTLITLIGVAVPLKHLAHIVWPVTVMGPVHGLALSALRVLIQSTRASTQRSHGQAATA